MKINAKDIARQLNISPSAVSMALNNRPGISKETRQMVLDAAVEMGYQKPTKVISEVSRKFIQLIIYKKHGDVVSDTPFFAELTQGIDAQTKKCGYSLIINYFYKHQNISEQLYSIMSSKSDGIILLATEMESSDLDYFSSLNIPVVVLDNYFPEYDYNCVVINNFQGALKSVSYLYQSGHTDIGYLSSKVAINNFRERMQGYKTAMRSIVGEKGDLEDRIVNISPTSESAYNDMIQYLSGVRDLPTAFFADNDIIAVSCIKALTGKGYRVPEDVSVIGLDDVPIAKIIEPALTTMAVPKAQFGMLAVNRLISMIQDDAQEIIKIELSTKLVIRNSVANRTGGS